jgi:deazaflavin-dependent oxidoreductase (nitroreductase family)
MDQRLARRIARFNLRFTNRVTGPLAPHLPGFGVVTHVGRRSGRRYETPVNVFPHGDGFVFTLIYGREAQWVRNVTAAGTCELTTRGRRYHLVEPQIFSDDRLRAATPIVRPILRLIGVHDFLRLRRSEGYCPDQTPPA